MAPKRIAKARIGQVSKPVNAKADSPKMANWVELIDIPRSYSVRRSFLYIQTITTHSKTAYFMLFIKLLAVKVKPCQY
jgi:hypothetical protein